MLENKSSRVYCFCAVRSYHRSSRSAPKTRSRQARTITEMGLFCTNRSNTSPSMAASLMAKVKKAYRTQYRHTLTPLLLGLMLSLGILPAVAVPIVSITEGPFLPAGGATFFIPGTIDNATGAITFTADTLQTAIVGVNGNGTLATVDFQALCVGTSLVALSNVILLDSALGDITAS